MNYLKIYNDLIAHRKQNPAKGYTENHHIVMRSMGGSDTDDNLVRLTGREHWIAHLLLYKIHRNSKSIYACNMMAMRCEERGIAYIKNSRAYEFVRKQHAKLTSERHKITHKGEGNSQYGTRWICNIELKKNQKISKNEPIPNDWIIGRNKWKHSNLNKTKIGSVEHRERMRNSLLNYYKSAPRRKHTKKVKESISKLKKGNKSLTGMIWINNGIINKVIQPTEILPEGFIKGKLKRC